MIYLIKRDLWFQCKSKETSDVVNGAGTIQTSSNMAVTGNIEMKASKNN